MSALPFICTFYTSHSCCYSGCFSSDYRRVQVKVIILRSSAAVSMSKRLDSLRVVLEREMGTDSMLNIMHKFVQAVSVMDDTILVPIRLKDMVVNRPDHEPPPLNMDSFLPTNSTGDLYSFYTTLNTIKTELIGGSNYLAPSNVYDNANDSDANAFDANGVDANGVDANGVDANGVDANGVDASGDERDNLTVAAPPGECRHVVQTKQIATVFRHHLAGLFSTLKEMTIAANYLTLRYQEELGDNTMPSRLTSVII